MSNKHDDVAELDDDNDDDVAELDDDNDDDVAELDDDNDDDVAELDDDNDDDVAELDDDNDDDVAELDDENDDDVAELDDDNDDDVAELDDDNDDENYSGEYLEKISDRYTPRLDENGNIVGLQELRRDGSLKLKDKDIDESFAFVDGFLLQQEIESDGTIELTTYQDIDGNGYFTKVSKKYLATADSPLRYAIVEEAKFVGTSEEDIILLTDDTPTEGGTGADRFIVREAGHLTVADFTLEEGDRVSFDTGLGLNATEELAQFVSALSYDEANQTLSVQFGDYVSLTIVGVSQQQISWDLIEVLS
jgi:hypothetical protein